MTTKAGGPAERPTPSEFLTNEPVAGERLSIRLVKGVLPPEEALRIALHIGAALQHAHSLGRIHGRISPAAVVITGGTARLLQPDGVSSADAAPYRSPEQVRGEACDWRSDIFSYGALLYELVSGHSPFTGGTAEMERAIREEPAAVLNAKTPIHAALEGVIAGCLQKDPAARRQRIQNALIELKLAAHPAATNTPSSNQTGIAGGSAAAPPAALSGAARYSPGARSPRRSAARNERTLKIAALGGLILVALTGAAFATMYLQRDRTSPQVLRFSIAAPKPAGYCSVPAISPDGRFLACTAPAQDGQTVLWIRGFDETDWSAVEDSEGAFAPFWSPDSRYLGFFARGLLLRAATGGDRTPGGTRALFEVHGNGGGGSWNRDGRILFAPNQESGLELTAVDGGKPQSLLDLRRDRDETAYLWPQFLPDGRHFIFYVQTALAETSGIAAGSLDSRSWKFLFPSDSNAVYSVAAGERQSRGGYLLYIRDGNLRARDFNPATLEFGEALAKGGEIGMVKSLALAPLSVSNSGTLVYEKMDDPTRQLQWLERGGKFIRGLPEAGLWGPPRVSPDGRRVALTRRAADGQNSDLWLILDDGTAKPVLSVPGVSEAMPVWSPDGSRLAYSSNRDGVYDIFVMDVQRGMEELLYQSAAAKYPTDWTADGRYLIFSAIGEGTGSDLWALSISRKQAAPILQTIHAEGFAVVSPDGKWMAYESDETGRTEIYVQPFDPTSTGTKRRVRVSADGGDIPYWSRRGTELIYMTESGHLMSARIRPINDVFDCDPAQMLFQVRPMPPFTNLYTVSPDGERFLINAPLERTAPDSSGGIMIVTNWTELRKPE